LRKVNQYLDNLSGNIGYRVSGVNNTDKGGTTLASKDYSESRRKMAIDKNLAGGLAAARAKRVKKK
jgi:hypothetical protein